MAASLERAASKRGPGSIFICYRRSDTQGYAGRLQDSLKSHFGDRHIFRDVPDMKGGASVSETLDAELTTTDATLVLIGSKWLADDEGRRRLEESDDFVAHELRTVLATDMTVIPVLVEGARMPRADELPEALRPLADKHAVSLHDERWQEDVRRLAQIIAIDVPSTAERNLMAATMASAVILFVGVAFPLAVLTTNLFTHKERPFMEKWHPGVTGLAIAGSCLLLIRYRHLLEPVKRRWMNHAIHFGLAGGAICFVAMWPLPPSKEPLSAFLGATIVALGMLVLLSISGFRAK